MSPKNSNNLAIIQFLFILIATTAFLEAKISNVPAFISTKAPRESDAPPVVGSIITQCNNAAVLQTLHVIDNDITQCCNELKIDFNGTFTTLAEISNLLTATSCIGIPITTPTTISESGYYCLAHDIEGQIIIDANNVVLDLNNHRITTNNFGDALTVTQGINRIIKNGIIANSNWGIVLDGNTTTEVSNITFSFCGLGGILVINSINLIIQSISMESTTIGCFFSQSNNANVLKDIYISQPQLGMVFENLDNSIIQNCHIFDGDNPEFPFFGPSNFGFGLLSGNNTHFDSCTVKRYTALGSSTGFFIDNASNIVLKNCITQSIASLFPPNTAIAQGFWYTQLVNNLQLLNCSAIDISGTATSYGFLLLGNDFVVDSCITQSSFSRFSPALSYGFLCSGSDITVTNCQAHAAFEGFFLTTPVSAQKCQSSFNHNGFTILDPTAVIGNCIALNNSVGFNASSPGSVYNCFAAQNSLMNYFNVPNTQNANAQVDTSIVGPSGPFAGGNLFM